MSAICGALCTLYTAPYDDSLSVNNTRCNIYHTYHKPHLFADHILAAVFHILRTIYLSYHHYIHYFVVVKLSKKEVAGLLERIAKIKMTAVT